MGKDIECTVQSQGPTVAEATQDRAPPMRVTVAHEVDRNPVVIHSKEYQALSGQSLVSGVDTHTHAYGSDKRHSEFNEHDLPVHAASDTMVLEEKQQQRALSVIASVGEPVTIKSTDDLPNQVADPETVGRDEKEKRRREEEKNLEAMQKDLRDPKVLDLLCRLINMPNRANIHFNNLPLEDTTTQTGKQCGGGSGGSSTSNKGSQTESTSSQGGQGGLVTGCPGRSHLVVGGLGGGGGSMGGGGGGGDDEDPRKFVPFNSHYYDFMGFEEQPVQQDDPDRNAAIAILTQGLMTTNPMSGNPMLSQFNNTHEEPLSASLDGVRSLDFDITTSDIEAMDLDFLNEPLTSDAQYLYNQDPMFQVAPAEETTATAVMQTPQPLPDACPMAEESSDIKDYLDVIHMMKPSVQRTHPQGQMIGITPQQVSSIPLSQIPELNPSTPYPAPLPSPAPSNVSSYLAPSPSPLPPRTPMTPATPMTPITPAPPPTPPQTPSTPQPRGCFVARSFIEDNKRVCELSIAPDIPPEKRNTAFRAMHYVSTFYSEIYQCVQSDLDLKVANDVRAKMCCMENAIEDQTFKVSLHMPKDCKPLTKWLQENADLKDRLLVLQQVLNTLATIHTLGYVNDLTLWGSFMVWVANDLRVYLLVDFARLLQKQEEMACSDSRVNPRRLDVMTVKEIYSKVVLPCIGRDGAWASPALRHALQSFERFLRDINSSCKMAEAARILGEKRVCKVDVDLCLRVVFYCLEREELQTALRELSQIVPSRISQIWTVQSATTGDYMRVGDIATADRLMHLSLIPCMHPTDSRLLYIMCNEPN